MRHDNDDDENQMDIKVKEKIIFHLWKHSTTIAKQNK